MKFYNLDGTEVSLQEFNGDSVVVMRITKEMTKEQFDSFCKNNNYVGEMFADRGMKVLMCPNWIEFKEWK